MDCYDDGPSFFVRDSSGTLRIGLDYTEETETTEIAMHSANKTARLSISCSSDDDSVRVVLLDGEGRNRIEMRSWDDDQSISFCNEEGIAQTIIAGNSLGLLSDGGERFITYDDPSGAITKRKCVILKPFPVPSWKEICAVSVIGYYAMPGLHQDYRSEYLSRIGDSAHALLEFVRKDVAPDAKLEWETGERTMEQMVAMGATDDVDDTWAVIVGINVEFPGDARADVVESFSNAWMPRFSSAMQFDVPFDDPPNISILDGDQSCGLVLQH